MSNNAKKNTLKHPQNTNKTCFEAFWEILENPVLGWKMWFSAQISNYAKIPWNTQKTLTKHVLRLFKKFLKIRFSAQKSVSQPRCRTMLKPLWNTQKTPTKHALRHFKKFLKIQFLAEKSGSQLRCRIMLKYHETLRKHQLNMFWGFLRNSCFLCVSHQGILSFHDNGVSHSWDTIWPWKFKAKDTPGSAASSWLISLVFHIRVSTPILFIPWQSGLPFPRYNLTLKIGRSMVKVEGSLVNVASSWLTSFLRHINWTHHS